MAVIRRSNKNNFLTWQRVVGDVTLSNLQANGIPSARAYDTDFVITVKSDNTGTSADNQFLIPTIASPSGYNYDVITDEGAEYHNNTGDCLVTFATAGTHEVRIIGDFSQIYFNNGGDKLKILKVNQWGDIVWTQMSDAFYGCSNLDVVALDAPNISTADELNGTFRNCTSLVGNAAFATWDTSNISEMESTFDGATSFNIDLSNWDIGTLGTAIDMFNGVTLDTAFYSNMLIAWEAQLYNDNVGFSAGGSKYSTAAAAARANLISDGWIITDGGPA